MTQHQGLQKEGKERQNTAITWSNETLTCQKKKKEAFVPNEADSVSDSPLGGYTQRHRMLQDFSYCIHASSDNLNNLMIVRWKAQKIYCLALLIRRQKAFWS